MVAWMAKDIMFMEIIILYMEKFLLGWWERVMRAKGIMELSLFFQYSAISVAFSVIYSVQHLTEDAPDTLIISSRGFE